MNVPDDLAVAQRPHGVGQDVPAHGLHDVFREFRTVTFDPAPLLLSIDPHVGDGFSSETVLTDPRLHIGQPPAGPYPDQS